MNTPFRTAIVAVATVVLFTTTGCFGPAGPDVGFVEGTLTDNGKPVSGAKITFYPSGGRPSFGSTDADGHFELKYSNDLLGAVIGEHEVRINTMSMNAPQSIAGMAPGQASRAPAPAIPKQYSWPEKVEVTSGKNEVSFDLKKAKPG